MRYMCWRDFNALPEDEQRRRLEDYILEIAREIDPQFVAKITGSPLLPAAEAHE